VAIRFIESVGHYGTAGVGIITEVERKWTNVSLAGYEGTGGRRNAAYFQFGGNLLKTLTHQTRYIQGVAAQMQPGAGALGGRILSLCNNTTEIVSLIMNPDATLSIRVVSSNTGLSTIAVNDPLAWHYYEMDGQIGASGGNVTATASIMVDGNSIGQFSGTSGLGTGGLIDGSATVNQVGVISGAGMGWMDYYCLDTNPVDINGGTASTNTTFLGDVEIDALFPAADVTTQWGTVGGDGTHAYTCVNATNATDDTDYIYTSSTGQAEGFNYQPIIGFNGTLLAAQYLVCCRKDAEGSRVITIPVHGTNLCTSIAFLQANNYLSDFYTYYICPLDTDFGTAWTTGVYNAEQFGIKLQG
jgi:hypothetical protein